MKRPGDTIAIQGVIENYKPGSEYEIRILESTELETRLLHVVEHEQIKNGKVNRVIPIPMNYNIVFEVWEDDTVRCILISGEGDYLKNPITEELFHFRSEGGVEGIHTNIKNLNFHLDPTPERMLDYNLGKVVRPTLKVSPDYMTVVGEMDSLPPKARLVMFADGGYSRERYEFLSTDFELKTDYKINYIDMFIVSQYGWKRHLQKYDIKYIAVHY